VRKKYLPENIMGSVPPITIPKDAAVNGALRTQNRVICSVHVVMITFSRKKKSVNAGNVLFAISLGLKEISSAGRMQNEDYVHMLVMVR
jgi:hypothetical protein